ncbi:MAG TPA: glycosyltransferase [Longimicrobium sp.]
MSAVSLPAADEARAAASGAPGVETRAAGVTLVVPVLNTMRYLRDTVPSVLAAARCWGNAEVVYVDHGSTDGSYEFLRSLEPDGVRVIRREGGSIGALRNAGAREGGGAYLAFVDADCLVPEGYLEEAIAALGRTGAAATGCEARAPEGGHWIEAAWDALHFVGRDRFVHYLNSANFFISRAAFDAVGGFREDLATGEDSEIGRRLLEARLPIWECARVSVVHLGNPRSIREFWRRTVWHGLGMFATVGGPRFDRPLAMMAAHLACTLAGVALLFRPGVPLPAALGGALALQLAVPAATVAYRCAKARRVAALAPNLALYWLYYWARLHSLALIASGKGRRYRK